MKRSALACAALLIFAACQKNRTSEAGPRTSSSSRTRPVPLRRAASTPQFMMTVLGTQRCTPTGSHRPRSDHYLLGVQVRVQALSDIGVPVNPFYAHLTDAGGHRYPIRLDGCEPALGGAPLRLHETASGFISFEVAENATGLELRYAPELPGAASEQLDFAVGH